MGMPANGRAITITAIDIGHIEGGQAREPWGGMDQFALLQQLGALGSG